MVRKQSSKELIKTSMYELLSSKSISQVSVRDICKNCGITTRAFYNNYIDKYDVITQMYIAEMKPYIGSNLEEWCERRSEVLVDSREFFRNCIGYNGQNNLTDVVTYLDKEKYAMHIRPGLEDDPEAYRLVKKGISFFIYGNIGFLKENYNNSSDNEFADLSSNKNTWELMRIWIPQIVNDNLCMEPCRKPSAALLKMLENV